MQKIHNITVGTGDLHLKVVIPWTGEPQLANSLSSLRNFSVKNSARIDITILIGFKNREVHQLVYDEVGSSTVPTIKLDGDMCLENFEGLTEVVEGLGATTICIAPVHCHILKRKIYGVHIFGKNVRDLKAGDETFPDKYEWKDIELRDLKSSAFISHCPCPTAAQIDNFIAHRLRKFIASRFSRLDYLHLVLRALCVNQSAVLRATTILNTARAVDYKTVDSAVLQTMFHTILQDYNEGG